MSEPHITRLSVGMLGTNCYLLWQEDRDDAVVIDPGGDPERILAALQGRKIAAILLTHGHFDHIGAVKELKGINTELVIHPEDAPMLTDSALNASWLTGMPMTSVPATMMAREGNVLELGGISFTVLHTPGHTAGSVCYLCGKVMFTGDTIMSMGTGRTDLPTGSDEAMEVSLERLYPLRLQYRFLGGHG